MSNNGFITNKLFLLAAIAFYEFYTDARMLRQRQNYMQNSLSQGPVYQPFRIEGYLRCQLNMIKCKQKFRGLTYLASKTSFAYIFQWKFGFN